MVRFLLSLSLSVGVISLFVAPKHGWTQNMEIGGYVQALGVVLDQSSEDQLDPSTGAPLNRERFLIRRARLRAISHNEHAFGHLEIDGNTRITPQLRLVRAFAGLSFERGYTPTDTLWPIVAGQVGLFNTPFGRGVQESSQRRAFVERSNAEDALFPGSQDLGGQLFGQWRFVRYQLALMNGTPIGDTTWEGQDPASSLDLVGRLGVDVHISKTVRIDGGFSLLQGQGFSPGTPGTKDTIQWRDANENGIVELSEIQPIAGRAGRPSETFERSALGGDIRGVFQIPTLGLLTLGAEVFWALNLDRAQTIADPVVLGRDLREVGYALELSQELFGHGHIAARYDHYNPDADANEQRAATLVPLDLSVSTFAVVLGWTTFDPFTVSVEYNFNDNNFGRNAQGEPTRLEDDRLLLRVQVGL